MQIFESAAIVKDIADNRPAKVNEQNIAKSTNLTPQQKNVLMEYNKSMNDKSLLEIAQDNQKDYKAIQTEPTKQMVDMETKSYAKMDEIPDATMEKQAKIL